MYPRYPIWVSGPAPEPEDEEEEENDDGCFIATAAYGSEMADDVIVLKHFRDTVLLQSLLGRGLVKWYYAISPPLAEFIEEHETIRTATRCALTPVVYGVRHPKTGALIFLCSIMAILLTLAVRRSTKS
ncbi:MAG: CFI-box-CTERM domain-containing protein [Thermodesulfobacteriota bacterium]